MKKLKSYIPEILTVAVMVVIVVWVDRLDTDKVIGITSSLSRLLP